MSAKMKGQLHKTCSMDFMTWRVAEDFSSGEEYPINDFVLVSHTTALEGP